MKQDDILWLDLETRSRADLKQQGAYVYAEDPDHKILVANYALGNGKVKSVLTLYDGLPDELVNMLNDKRLQVRAHNAAFDRIQLEAYGIVLPLSRWYCTAAQARAMALPGSLGDACRALGLSPKLSKNEDGKSLIHALCIPDKDTGEFCNDPKLLKALVKYGNQDVVAMRALSQGIPELPDFDLEVYQAGEWVNDQGMPIDLELCRLAQHYAAVEKVQAEAEVVRITKGVLKKATGTNLTNWVHDNLPDDLKHMVEVLRVSKVTVVRRPSGGGPTGRGEEDRIREEDDEDVQVEQGLSLAKDIREKLLEIAADDPDRIPQDVVEILEANEAASFTSVGKFRAMEARACGDGRLRGAFMFNGAGQTGRWSSHGAQLHNYPRLCAEDPEAVLKQMRRGEQLDNTLEVLKSMLRPAINPGVGRRVVRCDWNAVEARGLPWLAGPMAADYLDAFRDPGRDIYIEQAKLAGLGEARPAGKVVVLALGFGGAAGALTAMCRGYKVKIENKHAVVDRWRRANPWAAHRTLGWWHVLKQCALRSFDEPGAIFQAERVCMAYDGYSMIMVLPSGRKLYYPSAVVEQKARGPEIQALKASWKAKAGAKSWPRARIWHGTLAENATQASMNDLLRHALVQGVKAGLPIIGHVHDELICEEAAGRAQATGRELKRCMLAVPAWADGLPLAAEVDIAPRFRK